MRDYTPINERFKDFVEVKDVVNFINSKSAKAKINTSAGLRNYCPAKKLKLTVNKEIAKTFVPEEYQDKIVDEIRWSLKGNGIYKNKLMVLDILAHFNWERPIYFAITVGRDNFMGLEKYFQLEGLAYRLVPYVAKSPDRQTGIVNTHKMYDRLVTQFEWGGLNNPDLYFDETNTRMVMNFRNNYSRLSEALYQKGAKHVIKQFNNQITIENTPLLAQKGVLDPKTGKIKQNVFFQLSKQTIKEITQIIKLPAGSIDSAYVDSINLKALEVLDVCMAEFPRDVVNLSYFALPIIDIYYKLGEVEKGNQVFVTMLDDYLTEIKYLKQFDKGSGLKRNKEITGEVLTSLGGILQRHKLEDSDYSYSTKDDKYYKHLLADSKAVTITDTEIEDGIEIDYETYRINTFMQEYLSIQ